MRSSRGARSSARSGLFGAALIAIGVLAVPVDALGYCRTSLCGAKGVPGQVCTPAAPGDCGTPLFWAPACFGVSVQQDASSRVDLATAEAIIRQAFATWETAPCPGGGNPAIFIDLFEPVSCDQQEYNQRSGNVNVLVFRDDEWPYAGSANTLALTTVTYDLDTGQMKDADLEVNSTQQIAITTGDSQPQYDLASILTHEAGHMLGLAHSTVDDATMATEYIPGTVDLRTLDPDDVAAICDAYPPPDLMTCDTTPFHGFKGECGDGPPVDEGCQCRAPGVGGSDESDAWPPGGLWIAAAGVLALRQRRRARRA